MPAIYYYKTSQHYHWLNLHVRLLTELQSLKYIVVNLIKLGVINIIN